MNKRGSGLIGLVLLVVALAVVAGHLPGGARIREIVESAGSFAPVAFVAICAVGTAAFFPKPVLATAAGLLFGVAQGTVLAVVGFTAGALIAFAVGRKLGRQAVAGWLGARLEVMEDVFGKRGIAATLVVRLLPVLPYTLANYGAGVTSVRGRHFAVGTTLGLVPSTVLAAVLGDALSDLGSPRSIVALTAWAVLAGVGVWWGRRLLKETVAQKEAGTQKAAPIGDRDGFGV